MHLKPPETSLKSHFIRQKGKSPTARAWQNRCATHNRLHVLTFFDLIWLCCLIAVCAIRKELHYPNFQPSQHQHFHRSVSTSIHILRLERVYCQTRIAAFLFSKAKYISSAASMPIFNSDNSYVRQTS